VATYLVRELGRILPEADRARLARYAPEVRATTRHGDLRRAYRCAEWAVRVAGGGSEPHHGRLIGRLRERLDIGRDSLFGAHFGVAVGDGVGPGTDVEIQWVEAAVTVAAAEAEQSGWDAVPWEDLVRQVLDAEPTDAPPGDPDRQP
jgi:hypothetical protein